MKVKRKCENCGKEFDFYECKSRGTRGKFCSRECYNKYVDSIVRQECPECGRIFEYPKWKHRKFCSQSCASKNSQKRPSAHRQIKCAGKKNRYRQARSTIDGKRICIHRALMERKIGRRLSSQEHVHHVDMDPSNNSIENLYLYANAREHGRGHRTLDKILNCLLESGIVGFESGRYYLKDKIIEKQTA